MAKHPAELMMDALEWNAAPDDGTRAAESKASGLPYATHEAVLDLGGFEIKCYQLSDGQRILDAEDVREFFGGALLPNDGEKGTE